MERAVDQHMKAAHANKGSDPFKWAVLIAIGYECFEKYRETHGFTVSAPDWERWIFDEAALATHDGDCDYLALFAGRYDRYVKEKLP